MGGKGSGGAREGAGRKTQDGAPRVKITVTLPAWMVSTLRAESDHRRVPTSQVVTELIKKGLER